ncbi:MAG TPA: zinc ribbon domain-containing protein [Proteobacteria bacterium]|nr:zinc ribbon domain-containing protein [Pseudomonadota bacterium]
MPIFEFRCKNCGHQFETITGVNEDGSGLQCPKCSRPGPEKLLSIFSSSGGGSPASGGGGCGHSSHGGFS